jgi:L-lactate dehydrogenase complex protein LldF
MALPGADALRDRARQIRAHTIAPLDRYLARFADAAEQQGAHVFWADTAEDANRYVTDLARARGVRLAVKSKSMVSEELELNNALEQAGVRVVETDLGEFVVQLAGDHPSHIIAPIVHWTRGEVADLFRQKLGADDDEVSDIPAMTALARRTLRQEFLAADMGISGANFAVAETGSLSIVTNEGNGRLTTSAPRLHVALVGIERVVPRVEDLGVMLQLLARSATGQKLSVHHIITGPRCRSPSDGPVHAGAEPDGRTSCTSCWWTTAAAGSSEGAGRDSLLHPLRRLPERLSRLPRDRRTRLWQRLPRPGRICPHTGTAGIEECSELPHASSLCGRCLEVCPVRIDIPRLLLRLRADARSVALAPAAAAHGLSSMRPPPSGRGCLGWRPAGQSGHTLARRRSEAPAPRAWTDHRDFPAMARRSFTELWSHKPQAAACATGETPRHWPKEGEVVSAERERMLRRVADALRKARAAGETPAPLPRTAGGPPAPPRREMPAPLGPGGFALKSLVRRFSEELAALTGRAHSVASVDEAVSTIQEIVARTGSQRILCWDAPELGENEVASKLVSGGTEILRYELAADADERRRVLAELDPVQVGLTGATAGLADTGSIVLASGPGRGRLVSLLPPVHIALLSRQHLYPSLPSFLEAHPGIVTQGSNLVIITGPSRTADIEMTLTHGVHGPREVHVILMP